MTDHYSAASDRTVAVLGTGLIGAALARNLARKGYEVRAWNRTSAKAQTLAQDGVSPFEDIQDAVRGAGIIITVLKDGDAVNAAIAAAQPALQKGAVWLQISTVGAEATEKLALFASQHNLTFYDAPVQGTRQPAEQGKLVILASGPTEYRQTAQGVFDSIGQRTIWVSDKAGDANRLKLALNSYVFALTHGIAESLTIARTLGIDPGLVVDAVTGGPLDSGFFQAKSGAMLKGDYSTSFSVENAVKDSQLVLDVLQDKIVPADLAAAGLARFIRAAEAGHGDKDMAASFLA